MDCLRGIAVLLVIVWHAVSIPTFFGLPMPRTVELVNDALSPFRIPALLVLSGLLLHESLRKPPARYYVGKIANIGWPLLVWGAIYLLANPGVDGGTIEYWLGGSYLWYLFVVLACYLIGPVVRWVPALLVAAVFIAALLITPAPHTLLAPILEYGPYFFLGVAARPIAQRVLQAPGWLVTIGALVAVGGSVFSTLAYGYSPRIHIVGLPVSLIGIACAAWLLARMPRAPRLEWIGRHSLHFYVAHFPVMVVACRFGAMDLPTPLAYLLLLALGVGVGAVLAAYLPGAPLFRLPMPASFTRRSATPMRVDLGSRRDER